MNILRYQANRIGEEIHDTYGVVSDDRTQALRANASDYGQTTVIERRATYRGDNLEFSEEGRLNDPSTPYVPRNAQGQPLTLTLEVTPPLSNLVQRQLAVAAFAAGVLDLDGGMLRMDLSAIPGKLSIQVSPRTIG